MDGHRPDWYPDPSGRFDLRYHNGRTWTADVSSDGRRYVDQLPSTPVPGTSSGTPTATGRNGLAVAALVLGIVGLATSWMPYLFVIGAIAAVLAISFGIAGLRRSAATSSGRGPAIAGLITGGIAVPAAVGGFFFTVALDDALEAYDDPGPHEAVIEECTVNSGSWTATGTIENLADDPRDYTLDIAFVRAGTDNVQRAATVEIDDVDPGEEREFSVERRSSMDDLDCVLVAVHGPLPFGFDLD